jgi:hypothetical protein
MVIKGICTFPIEKLKEYSGQAGKSSPLPECLRIEGPYITFGKNEKAQQIVLYEFEKGKLMEACKYISKQLEEFKNIPGFSFSFELLEAG